MRVHIGAWTCAANIEDLDAFHFLPTNRYLFSTSTAVQLGGVIYGPGDIIEFDGATYSLFFDEEDIVAAARNIDALTMLPNGNLLISTSLSAEIYGFSFLNGDVVEVDPVNDVASLYMGLNEATLFSGANQAIDALHFDPDTGNLIISVLTSGAGTIAGLAYSADQGDLFEIETAGVPSAVSYLEGDGLYDGETRQLNAAFVPEPGGTAGIWLGAWLMAGAARFRSKRATRQAA